MILKLVLILALVGLAAYGFISLQEDMENDEVKQYQGPVPAGYDPDYFKKTGEAVKSGIFNG